MKREEGGRRGKKGEEESGCGIRVGAGRHGRTKTETGGDRQRQIETDSYNQIGIHVVKYVMCFPFHSPTRFTGYRLCRRLFQHLTN